MQREQKWNDHKWLFLCDCGNEKVISITKKHSSNVIQSQNVITHAAGPGGDSSGFRDRLMIGI